MTPCSEAAVGVMKARRHMLAVEAFDVPGLPEGARKGG